MLRRCSPLPPPAIVWFFRRALDEEFFLLHSTMGENENWFFVKRAWIVFLLHPLHPLFVKLQVLCGKSRKNLCIKHSTNSRVYTFTTSSEPPALPHCLVACLLNKNSCPATQFPRYSINNKDFLLNFIYFFSQASLVAAVDCCCCFFFFVALHSTTHFLESRSNHVSHHQARLARCCCCELSGNYWLCACQVAHTGISRALIMWFLSWDYNVASENLMSISEWESTLWLLNNLWKQAGGVPMTSVSCVKEIANIFCLLKRTRPHIHFN